MATATTLSDYACQEGGALQCETMLDFIRFHAGYQLLGACDRLADLAGDDLTAAWPDYSRWFLGRMGEGLRDDAPAGFGDQEKETFWSMVKHAHSVVQASVLAFATTFPERTFRDLFYQIEDCAEGLLARLAEQWGWDRIIPHERPR